jgi:hypothetical protein
MPRDIIYYLLFLTEKSKKIKSVFYLYYSPEKYNQDKPLTQDPCKPLLIYNMSGISGMGKNTVLIIFTGFDKKRVEQLLNYYEPIKVYLFLQTGEQYKNNVFNAQQYEESFRSFMNIKLKKVDAFSGDFGKSEIQKVIIREKKKSNIIVVSLGPKPSSIAIFRLNKEYPDIGVAYVPVTKYDMNYSIGLSKKKPIFEKIK